MAYLYLLVVVFFSLSGFFSRISSSFFFPLSASQLASPFLINCFLFARDVQQLFTILSSIYLFICRHRSTLSIWWGQFFWRHLCLVYVKFIVKTTATLLCLWTVSIWLIDGTLGTMYPRERERERERRCSGFWFSLRKERLYIGDLTHFRFSRLHQNQFNNGREDDPFTFANFTMEGATYDLMANIFRDLEDRRWPFDMMRNMWSRT